MSLEANKKVVLRYYGEVLNGRNLDVLEELVVPDYVEHDMLPGQREGLAGLRDRATMLHEGLDPHFSIEDIIAEGDKVVVRWINSGTNIGDFLGIPATGKGFKTPGIDIYRLQDGKMVEHWHVVDQLSQMQQLGLMPSRKNAG